MSQNDIGYNKHVIARSTKCDVAIPGALNTRHSETPKAGSESVRKCAFTLAEVLITLGIIGVVAALTIPTLISNNNKRIVETRLAKFYSTINQAIELSEVENGPKENWELLSQHENTNTSDWFAKYLEPYLIKSNAVNKDDSVFVYFNDGSCMQLNPLVIVFYPQSKDIDNAIIGKNAFDFLFSPRHYKDEPAFSLAANRTKYHLGKGIEPYKYAWNGTEDNLRNSNDFGCNQDSSNTAYCTALIQYYGWKIPDDYPFKF